MAIAMVFRIRLSPEGLRPVCQPAESDRWPWKMRCARWDTAPGPGAEGVGEAAEDRRWSTYNNFVLDKASLAALPIQIDSVRLQEGYRC